MTIPVKLLLDSHEAAAALGVARSKFLAMVQSGELPKPRRLGARNARWLLRELTEAVEALPVSDLPPGPGLLKRAA